MKKQIIAKTLATFMSFLMVSNDLVALGGIMVNWENYQPIEEITGEPEKEHSEENQTIHGPLEEPETGIENNSMVEAIAIPADIQYGVIGSCEKDPLNNPFDDVFAFELSRYQLNQEAYYYLKYDLKGIKDGMSLPKSINNSNTFTFLDFEQSEEWNQQLEQIEKEWLVAGENYIRFTLPNETKVSAELRNLEVFISAEPLSSKSLKDAEVKPFESENGLAEFHRTKLTDEKGVVQKGKVIALESFESPSIPTDIVNVTSGAAAYRVIGEFKEGNSLDIPFDAYRIPAGYSAKDLRVFAFDYKNKQWIPLPSGENGEEGDGSGLTTAYQGGTDYIAGVIRTPEMPSASAFVPTQMSDIKAADPSAGMTIIQPPAINNQGTANVSYPIEVPPGRAGLQPNLNLSYSNEGGTGWLGLGWGVSIPSITVDTRWGSPRFDGAYETELYSLNGIQLAMEGDYLPHRPNDDESTGFKSRGSSPTYFAEKISGSSKRIERVGTTPQDYVWVVTEGNGTKYFYGSIDGTPGPDANSYQGNGNGVFEWKLRKVQDKWGNYMTYSYVPITFSDSQNEMIDGSTALVIDRIEYNMHTNGVPEKYIVQFVTALDSNNDPFVRKDASLNYKNGIKQMDGLLLEEIGVYYNSISTANNVRTYKFEYKEGNFFKTLLDKVGVEIKGNEFYSHEFEYHNCVNMFVGDTDNPNQTISTGYTETQFHDPDFVFNSNMSNANKSFTMGHSPLGASAGQNFSVGGRVGIGYDPSLFIPKIPSKSMTGGANISWNNSWNKGKILFEDIDGDGLPDLIRKDGNQLEYSKLKKNGTQSMSFGATSSSVPSASIFSKGYTSGINWGFDVSVKFLMDGYIGFEKTNNNSVTKNYMTDYNSDGLMDFVNERSDGYFVFFGRINNGVLDYNSSSKESPNPVIKGVVPDQPELDQFAVSAEVNKIWTAPFDGDIKVVSNSDHNGIKGDGVKVGLQDDTQWLYGPLNLDPGDFHNWTTTITSIDKGDVFIFRSQPNDSGIDDEIQWDPEVKYVAVNNNTNSNGYTDPNGFDYSSTKASQGFIISKDIGEFLLFDGDYTITWPSFQVEDLTDDVYFRVYRNTYELDASNNYQEIVTIDPNPYEYKVTAGNTETVTTSDLSIPGQISITKNDLKNVELKFEVFSTSNVDWKAIDWRPKVTYTSSSTSEEYTGFPEVSYGVYNTLHKFGGHRILDVSEFMLPPITKDIGEIVIQPKLNNSDYSILSGSSNNTIYRAFMVVKTDGHFLGTIEIELQNGQLSYYNNGSPVTICSSSPCSDQIVRIKYSDLVNGKLWVEYFSDNEEFAELLSQHAEYYQFLYYASQIGSSSHDVTNVFEKSGQSKFGLGYFNWGQFGWSGSHALAINPNDLTNSRVDVSSTIDLQNDPTNNTISDLNNLASSFDYRANKFWPFFPERKEKYLYTIPNGQDNSQGDRWQSFDPNLYVKAESFSPGWLGEFIEDNDTNTFVHNPTNLTYTAPAVIIANRAKSRTNSGNVGVASVSYAKSTVVEDANNFFSSPLSEFMDLNGDGYNDVILNDLNKVYYTNTLGGLRDKLNLSHPGILSKSISYSESENIAATFPGDIGYTVPVGDASRRGSTSEDITIATGTFQSGLVSTRYSDGDSETRYSLMDINGDGLPDRIMDKGSGELEARINTGYGFSGEIEIHGATRFVSHDFTESSNKTMSFPSSFIHRSFSGGIGGGVSYTGTDKMFLDVNGDGLVDQIDQSNGNKVLINTGTSFVNFSTNQNIGFGFHPDFVSKSIESTSTIFGSFTLALKLLGFKIAVTPDGQYGASLSRTHYLYKDINGDGYVDFCRTHEALPRGAGNSTSDITKIDVWYNNLGTSNMLKKVSNPLGGSFEIDYENVGNKYGNYSIDDRFYNETWDSSDVIYWDMPNSKWVMSELIVNDGFDLKNGSTDVDGVDSFTTNFAYDGGIQSRREKEFLGFTRIITIQPGGLQTSVQVYKAPIGTTTDLMIEFTFLKGIPIQSFRTALHSSTQKIVQKTSNTVELYKVNIGGGYNNLNTKTSTNHSGSDVEESYAYFPAITKNVVQVWYVLGNSNQHKREYVLTYDSYFNVSEFKDKGINLSSNTDDVIVTISYHSPSSAFGLTSLPNAHNVYKKSISSSNRLRKTVIQTLHASKAPKTIRNYINASTYAESEITYDTYGNVTKLKGPQNSGGQRSFIEITYDGTLKIYPKEVENEFGDVSEMHYDYRTGQITKTIDINDNEIEYEYDALDRLEAVIGPKEQGTNRKTIQFQYFPFGKKPGSTNLNETVPVAVTYHYNPEGDNTNSAYVAGKSEPIGSSIESYSMNNGEWTGTPSTSLNTLQTATFIDGLARVVQIKKDISVWNSAGYNQEKRSYSSPEKLDLYGRKIIDYGSEVEASTSSLLTYNPVPSAIETDYVYDNLNRIKQVNSPKDGGGTVPNKMSYTWATDGHGVTNFRIESEDPEGNKTYVYKDAYGRTTSRKSELSASNFLETLFTYDLLGQLVQTDNPKGAATNYSYDWLGRMLSKQQPDAGVTDYGYDLASNLVSMSTAVLGAASQSIDYDYNYGRLTTVSYPNTSSLNDLTITYGTNKALNERGRIIKKVQGNNQLEENFKYDELGQVTEQERTIWVPTQGKITYTTDFEYDTWGRVQQMIYPDGEDVRYHYSYGGEMWRMYGTNAQGGPQVDYVEKLGHDKYGNRSYLEYGNNTNTNFGYDANSLRLKTVDLIGNQSSQILDKTYTYFDNGNVKKVVNTAPYVYANQHSKLGGVYSHNYSYDGANRLSSAGGTWTSVYGQDSYSLAMTYDRAGGILSKNQTHTSGMNPNPPTNYAYTYTYQTAQPHTLNTVVSSKSTRAFTYDANGNMTKVVETPGKGLPTTEHLFWDESNMLQADYNQGGLHHFIYDSDGNRIVKGTLQFSQVDVNGNPLPNSAVTNGDYTVYANPYMVYNTKPNGANGYTKHYYVGSERIASAIGIGTFNYNNNAGASNPTQESLTVHPIWETLLSAASTAGVNITTVVPAQPSGVTPFFSSPSVCQSYFSSDPDLINNCICMYFPQQGSNCNNYAPVYWYHPDYLGNTEFVSDIMGRPYQHFWYSPFGEELVSQHSGSAWYGSPYHFNAKEVDPETGYHYYGARYYNSNLSIWISVDPLADKYPSLTPYAFVANNPVMLYDPDGREWVNAHDKEVARLQQKVADNPGKNKWVRRLNYETKLQDRANSYMQDLQANDPDLYDYIDNLTVQTGDNMSKPENVIVSVSADPTVSGNNGQVGITSSTPISSNGDFTRAKYGNKGIIVPRNKNGEIGFDVTIYGNSSFGDERLANEVGDVMFFMNFNDEAISSGGSDQYFAPRGGGMNEYLNSPSGSYSNKIQSLYIKRKASKRLFDVPYINPYPQPK